MPEDQENDALCVHASLKSSMIEKSMHILMGGEKYQVGGAHHAAHAYGRMRVSGVIPSFETPSANKKKVHRVQKSDAGVGIGTLIGDRDYFAQK